MMKRTDIVDRAYRVFTYQSVDRVPDIEFGYWPQTIRRWLKEGMPAELTAEEQGQMFCGALDRFFGFDKEGEWVSVRGMIHPPFPEEIIERRENTVVVRDASGVVSEQFTFDQDESSIPHFLEFPVKAPEDWAELRERYLADDPIRRMPAEDIERMRAANRDGRTVKFFCTGFYGQLRNWMGMENLSLAFYDEPEMIHAMVDCWAELCALQIERLPEDIRIDQVDWWEDMAGRNGPLVSPAHFAEFIQPAYRRVMTAARKRGCVLSSVDSDGNPHALIKHWLAEGVNIMFPIEVGTWHASIAPWREQYGRELRGVGGMDKKVFAQDRTAVEAEVERLRPLVELGGFIPCPDHRIPPDAEWDNVRYYCDRMHATFNR